MEVTRIGLDIAKNVFQAHGVGEAGEVVLRRRLRRGEIMRFLLISRLAWLQWKRARPPITGLVRSWASDTRCVLSRRAT